MPRRTVRLGLAAQASPVVTINVPFRLDVEAAQWAVVWVGSVSYAAYSRPRREEGGSPEMPRFNRRRACSSNSFDV
jgi:hypothetical protein